MVSSKAFLDHFGLVYANLKEPTCSVSNTTDAFRLEAGTTSVVLLHKLLLH